MHASKYKQIAEDMEQKIVVPTKREDDAPPITQNRFLQKEEKEWINRELAEFIETL